MVSLISRFMDMKRIKKSYESVCQISFSIPSVKCLSFTVVPYTFKLSVTFFFVLCVLIQLRWEADKRILPTSSRSDWPVYIVWTAVRCADTGAKRSEHMAPRCPLLWHSGTRQHRTCCWVVLWSIRKVRWNYPYTEVPQPALQNRNINLVTT